MATTVKIELVRCDCKRLLARVIDGKVEVYCPRCKERRLLDIDKDGKTD